MINIDFNEIFDLLDTEEQHKFLIDKLDDVKKSDMLEYVAKNYEIHDVISEFSQTEIEDWMTDFADDYGYVPKEED